MNLRRMKKKRMKKRRRKMTSMGRIQEKGKKRVGKIKFR